MNGGNDGLERFAPAPIEDSEVVVGTILFGLMSSVSYLLVQPPCPEAFLGIPRLRAQLPGASGSHPNLTYHHGEFLTIPQFFAYAVPSV